jgi:hypothetical protein
MINAIETKNAKYRVTFLSLVKEDLQKDENNDTKSLNYVSAILSHNPHPHSYRCIKVLLNESSIIAVIRWRFYYSIEGQEIKIYKLFNVGKS